MRRLLGVLAGSSGMLVGVSLATVGGAEPTAERSTTPNGKSFPVGGSALGELARQLESVQSNGLALHRDEILRHATLKALQAQVSREISVAEVDQQVSLDQEQVATRAAIRLWRVLVATPEEARQVLAELEPVATTERWSGIARARSLDASTKHVRGDLGFVAEDGQRLGAPSVAPALFLAAERVSDGAVVSDPVAEGEQFAVVWRRGTRPAWQRGNQAVASAKQVLIERKVQAATAELIVALRAQYLRDHRPEGLEQFPWPTTAEPELLFGFGAKSP